MSAGLDETDKNIEMWKIKRVSALCKLQELQRCHTNSAGLGKPWF